MIDDEYIQNVRNMLRNVAVESLQDGGQTPLLAAIMCSEHPHTGEGGDGVIVMVDGRGSPDEDEFEKIKDEFAFACQATALAGRAHGAIFVSDSWFVRGKDAKDQTVNPDSDQYIAPSKRKDRQECLCFVTQLHDGRATMEMWPYARKGKGSAQKICFDDPEVHQLTLSALGGRMLFITSKPYPPDIEMMMVRIAYKHMGLEFEFVQPGASA